MVTFNHFLEAAAEKEVQGKARLQDFIENLLHRVELAEKQLEYYHGQHAAGLHWDTSEHDMKYRMQGWVIQSPALQRFTVEKAISAMRKKRHSRCGGDTNQ